MSKDKNNNKNKSTERNIEERDAENPLRDLLDGTQKLINNNFGKDLNIINDSSAEVLPEINTISPAAEEEVTAPLIIAIKTNNLASVRELVELGANINLPDSEGYTPLMEAVLIQDTNIINFLCEKGAEINHQNELGHTPLIQASIKGMKEIVPLLIEKGVNLSLKDKDGKDAIDYIGENFSKEEGNKLIQDIFISAVKMNNTDTLEFLINKNIDKEIAPIINTAAIKSLKDALDSAKDEYYLPPLVCAAKYGDLELVETLVKLGADVNSRDLDLSTPLMEAVLTQKQDIVGYLCKNKADINAQNNLGETPLMVACNGGSIKIINGLIESGADIKLTDNNGKNALSYIPKHLHEDLKKAMNKALEEGSIPKSLPKDKDITTANNVSKDKVESQKPAGFVSNLIKMFNRFNEKSNNNDKENPANNSHANKLKANRDNNNNNSIIRQ